MDNNILVHLSLKEDYMIDGVLLEDREENWIHDEPIALIHVKDKIDQELREAMERSHGLESVYNNKWTKVSQGSNYVTFKNEGRVEVQTDDGLHEKELFTTITFESEDLTPEIVEKYIQETFLH